MILKCFYTAKDTINQTKQSWAPFLLFSLSYSDLFCFMLLYFIINLLRAYLFSNKRQKEWI